MPGGRGISTITFVTIAKKQTARHNCRTVIAYCCAFVAAPEIALPPSEMSSPTPRVVLQAVNTVESTRTEKIAAIVFFTITSSF
ncbi:hypothetical protein EcE24377A_4706 [Escherichia coli O139:H28 str. E24377A]|uniref:Uncharacterized protein n=2 Tax=Escherichia coli TaxID=562 RepID=A7ZV20_ECO24|nr:hypothetical protein EcE24377A_4706 [Escherichia coli O139:H28 str. E24377A]EGB88607.1 hypothetical protein HMPREF9542_01931 [Escherichia coli MS 117-3]CAR01127.1 hypothetical protein ECIAI1_4384 [Escherichia coli IAI1]CAR15798.1 conserved hypothetical protein [Escherichia coli UMN026]